MGEELRPPALWKALPRMLRQSSGEWVDDNAPRLGAAVAFYTLLSLAPVIVLTVALAAVFYGQAAAEGRLASEIRGVAGPEVARTIQEIIKGSSQPRLGAIATLLGLATLTFGASSVFVELHDALNTIWHVAVPAYRSHTATVLRLIRDRFYSFVTVIAVGFLLLVSLIFNAWTTALGIVISRLAMFTILFLVTAALFAALYKIIPDVSLRWSDVAAGAGLTSLLFVLGKQVLGLYFANATFGPTYSAAGSPVVVLLWVYYSAQLFFWGAEFTKVYARTVGSHRVLNAGEA